MPIFSITFEFSNDSIKKLKKFPDVSRNEAIDVAIYSPISIELNDIIMGSPFRKQKEFTGVEYLWLFFTDLVSIINEIKDDETHTINFINNPYRLILHKLNNEIRLTFQSENVSEDEKYFKGKNIATMPIDIFYKEILDTVNKFIDSLIQINVKLTDNSEVKDFINNINEFSKTILNW